MKKEENSDELKAHYDFDYSKAQPNRFAEQYYKANSLRNLEADVAEAFPDSESVNEALRFLIRNKIELTRK